MKNKSDEEILKNMAVNNLYDLYLLADARADRVQSQLTEAKSLNEKLGEALTLVREYIDISAVDKLLAEYNKQKELS